MLCAHTVRRLKPGTAEEFLEAFRPRGENPPAGWVRFHALRNLADENEVVTFGFFDGTLPEAERARMDAHLSECDGCSGYLEDMRRLVGSLHETPAPPPDPHTRETLLRAFRDLRGDG